MRKNSIFSIKSVIRSDIRYPAKLLAGFPAKSVSGTGLMILTKKVSIQMKGLNIQKATKYGFSLNGKQNKIEFYNVKSYFRCFITS